MSNLNLDTLILFAINHLQMTPDQALNYAQEMPNELEKRYWDWVKVGKLKK